MGKQEQQHDARRRPLPATLVICFCQVCETAFWRDDFNIQELAGVMARARRDHAIAVHGWSLTERTPP